MIIEIMRRPDEVGPAPGGPAQGLVPAPPGDRGMVAG
jgi:hypothetical protein